MFLSIFFLFLLLWGVMYFLYHLLLRSTGRTEGSLPGNIRDLDFLALLPMDVPLIHAVH